jgi:2-oxoisovalerate dehydrogenase E1 component beta subunit
MSTMTFGRAINSGLRRALERDSKVVLIGEDIGMLGGVFRITDELQKDFGAHRVIDAPLAESAILGTAVGMAYRGYRPVCEIQFDGFIYPAFNQIVSQVAKLHYRTRGRVKMPLTIRVPFGGGIGAAEHHSESPEAYFLHTPGLRVVSVSNPQDAFLMIQQAIACDDPVLFFEPKRRYHTKGEVDEEAGLDSYPMEQARVEVSGDDATLVTYGPLVQVAREAAAAALEEGISLEVIDLRSLSPIDFGTVEASVRKTGRLVVVDEDYLSFGLSGEVVASVADVDPSLLRVPVARVAVPDVPIPYAHALEYAVLPRHDRIETAIRAVAAA